jgi:hypothetical protein
MKILNALNRRFGRFAIPNLTIILIVGQVCTYVLKFTRPELVERFLLIPSKVLEGEWWRVISFLFFPPCNNPLFVIFYFLLFHLIGTALEATWGTFNYNLYLLVGTIVVVSASFLTPDMPTTNFFLYNSLFLAFAFLYPDFMISIMFVLPVKIKWLALIDWIILGLLMLSSSWVLWIQITASVYNYLVFFSPNIYFRVRAGRWRMAQQARKIIDREKPRHQCSVCQATNLTHPSMLFRYCSRCADTPCFCEEHIQSHRHDENSKDSE